MTEETYFPPDCSHSLQQ